MSLWAALQIAEMRLAKIVFNFYDFFYIAHPYMGVHIRDNHNV